MRLVVGMLLGWIAATSVLAESRVVNLATRGAVGTGDNVLIGGFVVEGDQATDVLIRGRGPSLARFGIEGVLPNPALRVFSGAQLVESNDTWSAHPRIADVPSSLADFDPAEAAVVLTLPPGPYTAILEDADGVGGVGIVEVFELGEPEGARLLNVSTRGFVGQGDEVMIGSVIIDGDYPRQLVFRARGPSLAVFGLTGTLDNPVLQLFDVGGESVASNDDWQQDNVADIPAAHAPSDPRESVLLVTLEPGGYTAIVRGADLGTGIAIVEAIDVTPPITVEVEIEAEAPLDIEYFDFAVVPISQLTFDAQVSGGSGDFDYEWRHENGDRGSNETGNTSTRLSFLAPPSPTRLGYDVVVTDRLFGTVREMRVSVYVEAGGVPRRADAAFNDCYAEQSPTWTFDDAILDCRDRDIVDLGESWLTRPHTVDLRGNSVQSIRILRDYPRLKRVLLSDGGVDCRDVRALEARGVVVEYESCLQMGIAALPAAGHDTELSADEQLLFVSIPSARAVQVRAADSLELIDTLPMPGEPLDPLLGEDGVSVYVALSRANSVGV